MHAALVIGFAVYGVAYLAVDARISQPANQWLRNKLRRPISGQATLEAVDGVTSWVEPDGRVTPLEHTEETTDHSTVAYRGRRLAARRAAWMVDQIVSCRPCFSFYPTVAVGVLWARTASDIAATAAAYGVALALSKAAG